MQKKGQNSTRYIWYTAATATVMLLFVYALLGVYPFGGGTVITGDFNAQYINYFSHFKRVAAGEAGFAYGFDKALGGSLLGLFAYYVSSPFNLLYLLVPVSAFPLMASFIMLVKIVICCTFFAFFLYKKYPQLAAGGMAVSLGYGFCAYVLVYAQNIMWHDVVLWLPLCCWGVDRILAGKRGSAYTLCLAIAIFSNFYIGYMACIFIVLYFLYSILTQETEDHKALWKQALPRFAGGSLLAGGLNAVLLLPSLANINASKGSLLGYAFEAETNFSLARLPERLVWGNFVWSDVIDGLPEIYCGVLALLLAVCFFVSKKISRREKALGGSILLLLLLSFWIKGLDVIWHGFAAPVWFPYRYSFLFSFMLLFLAGTALAKGAAGRRELAVSAGILSGSFLLMLAFPQAVSRSKMLLTLGTLLLLAAALWLLPALRKVRVRQAVSVGLVLVVAVELAMQGYYMLDQFEKYPLATYQSFASDGSATVQAIKDADSGHYRVEKTFWRSVNDAMLLDYRGISHFGSTQDDGAVDTLYRLGYRNNTLYLQGSTAFADAVLGIRYVFSDGQGPLPAHLAPADIEAPYAVYENPLALPLFFTVPDGQTQQEWTEGSAETDIAAYQNAFYRALSGKEEDVLAGAAVQALDAQGGEIPLTGEWPAGGQYVVKAAEAGYYYAIIKGRLGAAVQKMFIDGKEAGNFFEVGTAMVIQLGFLEAGQSASLSWDNADYIRIEQAQFVYTPAGRLEDLAQAAAANSGDFALRGGYAEGDIEAAEGRLLLYTSIPYDENWVAVVNDKEVETQLFMGGLLAVPLQAGQNHVVLRYKVPLAGVGFCLTLASAVLFAAPPLWHGIQKKRKKKA